AYIAGRLIPKVSLKATLVGGLLPDIDICLVLWAQFNQIHRVVTHNLLFIILAAVLASLIAVHRRRSVFLGILLGGLLHLLLDACFDTNPSNGIGVALLWPLSSQYFSPINLLTPAETSVTWHQPLAMVQQALKTIWWEIPPCVVALILRQKSNVR
ncbi:MAG: metal-dependent hydrolase, partial [Leptolyngbya sp. SIO3F4]|nr:metal-dependent hydrolase [Leptolyngbya sp. SIO3F4]